MGTSPHYQMTFPNGVRLPRGVRSRFVDNKNGLSMHVLEAGYERGDRPALLLLHGFPELAYSWRALMGPLADAGYHVIAPDQRGYGQTTGWDANYDGALGSFRFLNLVRDVLGLLHGLKIQRVAAVLGHDFGAAVAAYSALIRPDIFQRLVLMSAPFAGPPSIGAPAGRVAAVHEELTRLEPPRKHYHWYYCTRAANHDMWRCPEGIHSFLRAYFHHKSADWTDNRPYPLDAWTATELAKLPTYYVMDRDRTMPETVAEHMPSVDEINNCTWLSEEALSVYAAEYQRTGFQGGLNWYRCRTAAQFEPELEVFSGRTIDVPTCSISGISDWGVRQTPGALEAMETRASTDYRGTHLVPGAGHWIQQEQPEAVMKHLLSFLNP